MFKSDEVRLREAVANISKSTDGQVFFAHLFDLLGYDTPMEANKDVALHEVWVHVRKLIPTRDLITIEYRDLRNKPVTEEMEKLWQTTTQQPQQPTQDQEAQAEPAPEMLHRRRMNL